MQLNSCYLDELKALVQKYGHKSFRGNQLYTFFHSSKRTDIENSNIPKDLTEELIKNEKIAHVEILKDYSSKIDETKKLLYVLDDENIIEGSLMKYKYGNSLCISTQVGCRMGCVFCASTKAGLVRNLTAAEMLSQIYTTENKYSIKVSNVILMGSGEPLDNYENVVRFLKIIHSGEGKNLSYRNITLSTCGVAENIYKFADEKIPVTLALSLHNTDNESRSELMPINRKYSIEETLTACKYYTEKTNTRLTVEYTLIKGVNDFEKNLQDLKRLLKGINSHVNLIPLNPIEEYAKARPKNNEIEHFRKKLEDIGLNVTIRRELGADIDASCGQLRRSFKEGNSDKIHSTNQQGIS